MLTNNVVSFEQPGPELYAFTIKILKTETSKIIMQMFKITAVWLYNAVMCPKDVDEMANSIDIDLTAPFGVCISKMIKFPYKSFFYVVAMALTGKLSCIKRNLVVSLLYRNQPLNKRIYSAMSNFFLLEWTSF